MKRIAKTNRRLGWIVLLVAISVGAVAFSILDRTTPTAAESASATPAPTVISTVPVGTSPFAVGVNPTTNRIFAVNNYSLGTVSEIDGTNNVVVATVPVGAYPDGIGVNPITNRIYVSNPAVNGTVSVIDGTNNSIVSTVVVGQGPGGVGVNSTTNQIYVANDLNNTVSVIDGTSNTVVSTVPVGLSPQAISVNPTTNRAYVVSGFTGMTGAVSVIDGTSNTIIATVPVGRGSTAVDVNPTTNRIYVANYDDNTVSVIDGPSNTVITTITVGTQPDGVGVNPTTNRVFVANRGDGLLSVIDGTSNTVAASVRVGTSPNAVAVNPTTNRVYVANNVDNTVSVIADNTAAPGLIRAPFNQGGTWTVGSGYFNNPYQTVTGCHIGTGADHCRNQLFGLDLAPDNQSDRAILAPVSGKVSWISSTFPGGCLGLVMTGRNNVTICRFQTKPAFSVGQPIPRGKVLGTRSTTYVHLSLDSRYATGTLCSDYNQCFLPVPFTGNYTLEDMSLGPNLFGAVVSLNSNGTVAMHGDNYDLCQSKGQTCWFAVDANQYHLPTALKGTSTNLAIP